MQIHLLAEKFHAYTRHIKGFSSDTVRRNRNAIRQFLAFAKITELEELDPNILRAWLLEGRTNRKWGASTFVTYHKSLKVFFDWCIREHLMATNPMQDIELPKGERRLPRKLSRGDAMRILEAVYNYPFRHAFERYRNHAIFSTFIFAGLRKQELLRLKFTDVDLKNLSVFVHQGKGSKDRVIPISYVLAESLTRYLNERQKLGKTCPEFFTSLKNNVGFPDVELRRLIDKVERASGVAFGAHMLRHTFATLMLEGGCDIFSLSKMMGHSDIKTTTIYLSATVEHLRSQISKHPLNF